MAAPPDQISIDVVEQDVHKIDKFLSRKLDNNPYQMTWQFALASQIKLVLDRTLKVADVNNIVQQEYDKFPKTSQLITTDQWKTITNAFNNHFTALDPKFTPTFIKVFGRHPQYCLMECSDPCLNIYFDGNKYYSLLPYNPRNYIIFKQVSNADKVFYHTLFKLTGTAAQKNKDLAIKFGIDLSAAKETEPEAKAVVGIADVDKIKAVKYVGNVYCLDLTSLFLPPLQTSAKPRARQVAACGMRSRWCIDSY